MKTRILLLALLAALLDASAPLRAAEPNFDFAFSQLRSNGAEPFAKSLYGPDLESAKTLATQLNPLIRSKGDYIGYEILSRVRLGSRIERLTLALYFEAAPIFMRIDVYESSKTKLCLPAVVSREAADILPLDLISAAGR